MGNLTTVRRRPASGELRNQRRPPVFRATSCKWLRIRNLKRQKRAGLAVGAALKVSFQSLTAPMDVETWG